MLLWDEDSSRSQEETDGLIEAALRKVGIWDALFNPRRPGDLSPSSSPRNSTAVSPISWTPPTPPSPPPEEEKGKKKKKKKNKSKKEKQDKKAKKDGEKGKDDEEKKKEDEPVTLDSPLNPSERLSIGQQQLFCLARALFQRSDARIILMDEFTSSMDHETEMLVREIVGRDLRGRTVVEVLHRLEHILDFDLVVVLEQGKIVEAGNPEELLQNEDGMLKELYQSMRG